jgi:NitT/TauT family transport system permease protein
MLVVEPDAADAPEERVDDLAVLDDSAAIPAAAGTDRRPSLGRRLWTATWPKVAAIAIAIFLWQVVVWSGWKPEYILPGPVATFEELGNLIADGTVADAISITMQRAAVGFALALVIGVLIGSVVASSKIVRSAVGSLITGIQTMPSIAWFPLAIVLFSFSEQAITFVVVLGAAPSIANGLISGVDHVNPILLRAGRVMGARGIKAYRHVVLPASLPSFVSGLKQGWAFAWRSLMAGELLGVVTGEPSVGFLLQNYRNLADYEAMMAMMIVILLLGIVVDAVFFGTFDRWVRRRYGLLGD